MNLNLNLNSLHDLSRIGNSFPFIAEKYSIVWMNQSLTFTYWRTSWSLLSEGPLITGSPWASRNLSIAVQVFLPWHWCPRRLLLWGLCSQFSSVQFSSVTQSCPTLCDHMNHSTPGLPVHQLLESTQTHVNRVSDAIQPSHPLSSPSPPAPNPSQHQGLFRMSQLWIRWPKYWSFSFKISPSNEHPGLISFRMDWLDFLVAQGTLKSLLQHHSSKASILQRSAFFIVQLSHPYTTTGKTIALMRRTFVGKVMSLLLCSSKLLFSVSTFCLSNLRDSSLPYNLTSLMDLRRIFDFSICSVFNFY